MLIGLELGVLSHTVVQSSAHWPRLEMLSGELYTLYKDGCPLFEDSQREILLIPRGVEAEICGVLASADDPNHAYVLASDDSYDFHTKEAISSDTLDKKVQHKIKFCKKCETDEINAILNDYGIKKPAPEKSMSIPRNDADYSPTTRKKKNQNAKYKQACDDIKKLSNVSIIVQELKLDNIQ
jgi:hypothetical protein